jgi:hypothetical protein
MDIFARITKVDERTRTVTGRAAQEVLDRSGEIMDYKGSKPLFQQWSAECFADSGGKSHGNVREMHSTVAAGKLTSITFDDSECAIDVEAQIVDDQSWAKVTSGVFTGFSIGGSYKSKRQEVLGDKMVTRYVAAPNEISLVDRPCIPTAKFDFTKRDGVTVRKSFKTNLSDYKSPMFEVRNGKVSLTLDASKDAIRKIHSQGPLTMGGDFLSHKTVTNRMIGNDPVVKVIRKAHRSPLRADISFDARELSKAFDSRRLRKVSFPPQSSNGISGGGIKDTGAANNWRDQGFTAPKPTVIGNQAVQDASLAAIRQDWLKPKRMGV